MSHAEVPPKSVSPRLNARSRRRVRAKRQVGWLREKSGTWLGTWRRYNEESAWARFTIALGSTQNISKDEAQKQLTALIEKDRLQYRAAFAVGPMAIAKQQRPKGQKLSAVEIGSVGELLVCADLLAKGFPTYRSVSHVAPCDILFMDGEKVVRVEVKNVEYQEGRHARVVLRRNMGQFDVLAIIERDGTITYRAHNGIGYPIIHLSNSPDQALRKSDNSDSTETSGEGVN